MSSFTFDDISLPPRVGADARRTRIEEEIKREKDRLPHLKLTSASYAQARIGALEKTLSEAKARDWNGKKLSQTPK